MRMLFLFLCCSLSSIGFAEEKPVLKLWPKGLPEGATELPAKRIKQLQAKQQADRVTYVAEPSLTVYRAPEEKANGCGVVIAPGGGYYILAWEKEGLELAEFFNSLGVTAFVLKYRVPRRNPEKPHLEPLQDAQRAIRLVRSKAKEFHVDPNRVGMLGFSAGGHLTAMTGMHFGQSSYPAQDDIDQQSCRPDFICPIYAAYLGKQYQDDKAELGPLVKVTPKTPPTFLAVTSDDKMRGAQAALFYVELRKANVPAELHVYTQGGHGYGIRPSQDPVSTWHTRCGEWLKAMGFLKQAE